VRGPKYVVKKGKTPVLTPGEARTLLDPIDVSELSGLRDRALIGVMVYSFARVSAVVGMNVEDYYQQGKRWWLRLHEKGGKHYDVPAHHNAEQYLDDYIAAAGIGGAKGSPLWRSMTKERTYSERRISRVDVFRMIKRRCAQAGLGPASNFRENLPARPPPTSLRPITLAPPPCERQSKTGHNRPSNL
jgi:integrase/recombinase XerD